MKTPSKSNLRTLVWTSVVILIMAFILIMLKGYFSQNIRPVQLVTTCRLAPNDDQIVFNAVGNGGSDLFLLDLNGLHTTQITNTKDFETCPAFSPDGRSIVYCSGRPGEYSDHLFIRNLDTNAVKQLTFGDANDWSPEFSWDGSQIVFTRQTKPTGGFMAATWGSCGSIWSINRDGTGLRHLVPSVDHACGPSLSPNGKTVLWCYNGVWIARADGTGNPHLIAPEDGGAVFSPDGDKIAFSMSDDSSHSKIYLIPTTGGKPTLLTQTSGNNGNIQFSHDGKQVYFFSDSESNSSTSETAHNLWRVDINGDNLQMVTDHNLIDTPMMPEKSKN